MIMKRYIFNAFEVFKDIFPIDLLLKKTFYGISLKEIIIHYTNNLILLREISYSGKFVRNTYNLMGSIGLCTRIFRMSFGPQLSQGMPQIFK